MQHEKIGQGLSLMELFKELLINLFCAAQLGRRVREMRETKAVPVPQTFERKGSTVGRKGLTHNQSLARGMEYVDPLGLG